MTVPGRVEAAALLLSLDPPAWFLHHARAVAEIAGWLGMRLAEQGVALRRDAVEAAGLLHDVDKLLPATDPAAALPHGQGSAAWLAARGHEGLGDAVAGHPVVHLADRAWETAWLAESSWEARIVAYADKRAGQRLESMADRFASWARRYPGGWEGQDPARTWRHAVRLEQVVGEAGALRPVDVRRLPWTARAIAAASRRAIPGPVEHHP